MHHQLSNMREENSRSGEKGRRPWLLFEKSGKAHRRGGENANETDRALSLANLLLAPNATSVIII